MDSETVAREAAHTPLVRIKRVMELWQKEEWEELTTFVQPSWLDLPRTCVVRADRLKEDIPCVYLSTNAQRVKELLENFDVREFTVRRIQATDFSFMRTAVVQTASKHGEVRLHYINLLLEKGDWYFNPVSALRNAPV